MTPLLKNELSFDSLRLRSLLKAPLSLKERVVCSLSVK